MSRIRRRVLVVEDHQDQALVLERWLQRADIDVHVAVDGDEGIFLARHGSFDAVISDLQLPGRSGIEVVRASKQASRRRPAIVMTAHGGLGSAVEALREDADDFLLKPLNREDVLTRLANLLRNAPQSLPAKRVVLAVGAHPDDVEIGVGGTLARHVAAGDRVVILTCSRGGGGGDPARREREAERAAMHLGADLMWGDLPDKQMSDGSETISLIECAIARYKPDVVYTHSLNDVHQDHRAVHRATLVAARNVSTVLCYQSPSTTIEFRPSRFVDVSTHIDTKTAILACHGSQLDRPYLDEELVRATARYWGRFAGFGDAEPFEIVRSE